MQFDLGATPFSHPMNLPVRGTDPETPTPSAGSGEAHS